MSLSAARDILERCDLRASRLTLLPGKTDEVYSVHARGGDRFVLRLRRAGAMSSRAVRIQQKWLAAIAAHGEVIAPRAVRVMDDAALFTWVQGKRVRSARSFVRNDRLEAMGSAAALLHRQAAELRIGSLAGVRRMDAVHFRCHLKGWNDRIRAAIDDLGESRRHFGLIHGDLEPPNWVFHQGQARPIDFDMFGVGYYLFDLAQILWTHSMWPKYEQYRSRLLTAYGRVRPLSKAERKHIRTFEAIPLIEWITRRRREGTDRSRAELRRWLPATMKRLSELSEVAET
jgi:Ser/Thr protein kinase RdoA (MazF antagonist)